MKIFDLETHKFADIFPLIEGEQLEQLKEDIREQGLLQPIVLFEGKILDGRNRYKAVMNLGLAPKFEEYKGNKPLEYVISLNLKRRHLNTGQRAVLAQEIMPLLEEEAEKKRVLTQGRPNKLLEKIPTVKFHSAKEAQKIMEVNERDIRIVKKLKEEGKTKAIEEIKSGHKTISDVKKEERLDKIKVQRANIEKNVLTKPDGNFDVIVIDPPWDYGSDESYDPDSFRGTTPYPTMNLKQIKEIKLPAEKDCVLWLWTTNKFLHEAHHILEEWNFELKTILTWDKEIIGTGRWLRSQTEHCLLAIKGKPFFDNKKYSTLLREKRTTHSTKPEAFYKMVEEICAGKKLDYFSRKKRKGWESYGDEC